MAEALNQVVSGEETVTQGVAEADRNNRPPVWDFSQERALTMSLINQRIHFFLIFFSLVVGGAISSRAQLYMQIVLCVGAVISWLLAVPIYYTQKRVDQVMEEIRRDTTHPYTILIGRSGGHIRVSALISYGVTLLCCVLLTLGAALSLSGYLTVAG